MADETFELSRRKALLGLGTVGVASVGAGMGTSAYFSDQEEFTDNTIQAGEFGLTVQPTKATINQDELGPDEDFDFTPTDNGEDGLAGYTPINITDAKPGDYYKFCWSITVEHNPGYVAVTGKNIMDETGDVSPDDLWDIDDEADLSTIGEEATATLTTAPLDDSEDSYEVDYTNLNALLDSLKNGILVSKGDDGAIEFDEGQTIKVCLEIEIPTSVGNEIQGAETTVDLLFYAEQARHNDPEDVKSNAVNGD